MFVVEKFKNHTPKLGYFLSAICKASKPPLLDKGSAHKGGTVGLVVKAARRCTRMANACHQAGNLDASANQCMGLNVDTGCK